MGNLRKLTQVRNTWFNLGVAIGENPSGSLLDRLVSLHLADSVAVYNMKVGCSYHSGRL